jgi:signal transduction histidine kinase
MDANSQKTLRHTLNRIIDVNTSDINTARRCRLLNILLASMFLLTLLSLITIYVIELFWAETLGMKRDENLQLYLWIWGILTGYAFFYFLNKKFPNGSAGFLFLFFLQISFAFSDEPAQLIDGRSLYVFTIPILLSSVLIKPYFSFIFAGLTILELNLLALSAGLTPQPIPYFAFIFLAMIAWLSASAMENAIKDLQALNLELDLRVAERTQDLLEANTQLQREIIEREQAEETIRQYADIVDTMQVGMYIVQAGDMQDKTSLHITAANPAALVFSGRSIKDSVGQPISGTGSIFNAKNFEQKCLAVIDSGIPAEVESIFKTSDGDLSEAYNIKIFPLTEESAGILFESILEKKLAEEQLLSMNTQLEERVRQRTRELETSNRELEAFSYTVSHDLRSPLRAINGYSNILLEDYYKDLPAPAQSLLRKIIASAAEMSALIDGLLSFSRTGRAEIRRQVIDTNLLVAEAWEIVLAESLQDGQIKFQCANLPPCKADPILLRQVFINLLSNAVKYSRNSQPAFIQVDWHEEDNKVVYAIRDNGVGFDMAYANKLFGVFQRLHHADEFEGTGIGLATSKRIITRHGGKIWAESELGKGSTFYFTLGGSQISAPITKDFTPAKTA